MLLGSATGVMRALHLAAHEHVSSDRCETCQDLTVGCASTTLEPPTSLGDYTPPRAEPYHSIEQVLVLAFLHTPMAPRAPPV